VKRINGYVKRHLGQGPNKDPLSWALERKEEVALMLGDCVSPLGDSERATELYEERQVYADPSSGGAPPLQTRFGKTVEKLRGTR
jgi:hypothetical protein